MTLLSKPVGQPPLRLRWLDLARGIAVILMVIYHFSWDLSFHGFLEFDVNQVLGWRIFARGIAASFLFLAGFSLWLAHRNGFRSQSFWRREIILVLAAGLVTLGTWYAFPSSYVFFGILHCIAASSLIALLFLRLPGWVTALAAVLVLAAPFTLANEAFNAPLLAFIGLRTVPPATNDYVPLLPWLSPLLAGLAAGQLLPFLARPVPAKPAPANTPSRLDQALAFLSRHSLIIYLVHQPLLFGATSLAASYIKPGINDVSGEWLSDCEAKCVREKKPRQTCIETCFCTLDGLEKTGAWTAIAKGATDPQTLSAINQMSAVCQK
ncbi:MAG: DUF1624 domain-containing protein [Beijerinckiaceae bacterium]|nr:DUF1624 domain-containing protein [Beijerinckiaceae bacterium]